MGRLRHLGFACPNFHDLNDERLIQQLEVYMRS